MNIDFKKLIKNPAVLIAAFSFLSVGSYLGGLKPVFAYELAQTNKKIDQFACIQIVIEYSKAKRENDDLLVAFWGQKSVEFNCTLPI